MGGGGCGVDGSRGAKEDGEGSSESEGEGGDAEGNILVGEEG